MHQPTVSDNTELGFPRRLPDQEAILIGRVDGGEFTGCAAYYIHGRNDILIGRVEGGEFGPAYAVECDSRLMSDCVQAFVAADIETDLSSIGAAVLQS